MKTSLRTALAVSIALAGVSLAAPNAQAATDALWPTGCHSSGDLQYAFAWCTGGAGQYRVLAKCTSGASTIKGPWKTVSSPVQQSKVFCGTTPYWTSYELLSD